MVRLVVLSIIFTLCLANLRFLDKDQLEAHHKHPLDLKKTVHQKLLDNSTMVQVHVIPHSHDDVGWLKTVDEYYYGQHNNIQFAGVQYVIDSYIFSLLNDPTKKFIQVEVAFFKMWWDEQNNLLKDQVKVLVKNGQLEFINGGWCMNDEATTYYEDIIDQMTLGHKFLFETFGVKPTIGWQIDPFGHQSSQASLFSQMGFNGWFFARIDYQDKEIRLRNQKMEMVMRPPQLSGEDSSIFTHVNYYHYSAPPSFDYTGRNDNEPIIDNINSAAYNVKERAEEFVYYFRNQTVHYRGNVVMHTLGDDFQWDAAQIYYKNIDKLLKYINARKEEYNMEIMYSTPSKYLEALQAQGQNYPTKDDDFFPYADSQNAYWTGYFTSRVAIKGLTRYYGRYSQIIHKFFSSYLANGLSTYVNDNKAVILSQLIKVEEAMSILQHHDAVSGTEKQHVTDDYIQTLVTSIDGINEHVHSILAEASLTDLEEIDVEYQSCLWNTTAAECGMSYNALQNNQTIKITVLDGKAQQYGQIDKIRIKVPRVELRIVDQSSQQVNGDILCIDDKDPNNCDLYFLYSIQTPSTLQYFKITATNGDDATARVLDGKDKVIYPEVVDEVNIQIGSAPAFKFHYGYYPSYQNGGQKSGAYIFRPEGARDETIKYGSFVKKVEYRGDVMKAVVITSTNTQTLIKQYNIDWFSNTYEIETFVDSISVDDRQGKEIVLLIETGINSVDTFYTDSNGLELQKRVVNFRPTWDLQVNEPASGNYYPVNGMIVLIDADTQNTAALVNDRSQGGTSLRNGQIEIMIHRRTLYDDGRGVGEALNEQEGSGAGLTQRILHQLTFFNKGTQPNQHRKLQLFLDQPAYAFLSLTDSDGFKPLQASEKTHTVNQLLDQQNDNGQLFKDFLQPWIGDTYLYRVQNLQEDVSITFSLPYDTNATETTLTGTQSWADWQQTRMSWNIDGQEEQLPKNSCVRNDEELKPLQIRTYVITFQPSQVAEIQEIQI